jgi:carbamoyl-phosphate synthase large subunit
MSTRKTTMLFLSGGSQVAQFMLAALRGRRDPLRLLATSSISDDSGLWDYDKVFLVPVTREQPVLFKQRVLDIVSAEGVDLIVPCRDDDIEPLAELAALHPELASKVLCGPPDVARAMWDKWLSFELSTAHGLPFAESHIPECKESPQEFAARVGYPVIAKPRNGFSSRGIFLIEHAEQLERAATKPNYVFQEYLDNPDDYWSFKRAMEQDGFPFYFTLQGLKHEIQVTFDRHSKPVGVFATYNRQAFRTRYVRPNTQPETLALGRQCGEVFSRLGWRGPLNIQCQRDRHGRLKIHEFNGRHSALSAERWMLGYDEIALELELFTGLTLEASSWVSRPAARAVAQLGSRGSDPANVAILQKEGQWSRPAANSAIGQSVQSRAQGVDNTA